MAIIVSTDVETVKQYRNKTLVAKINNKKQQIIFKLDVDDFSLDAAVEEYKANKNVAMIDFHGSAGFLSEPHNIDSDVYIGVVYDFGSNITEEDIEKVLSKYPEWMSVIIKLPEDYKDIYFLHRMCDKYPRVRFAGGVLFDIDGIRVGGIGFDILRKMNIKLPKDDLIQYNCLDVLPIEYSLEDLDVKVTTGKVINTTSKVKKESTGEKKPKVKVAKFDSFLNSSGGVEF